MIVVDTNVFVRLSVGPDAGGDAALLHQLDPRVDPEWTAPPIFVSELRNVLPGYLRRGDFDLSRATATCDEAVRVFGDRIEEVPHDQVIDTARECGLSAYDAEFVVLARTLGVALATLDGEILAGAPEVAVSVREAIERARRQ